MKKNQFNVFWIKNHLNIGIIGDLVLTHGQEQNETHKTGSY